MRTSVLFAAIVASLFTVCFTAVPGYAQTTKTGTSVAVLDVGMVFEESVRFKDSMEIMKLDVQKFETYIRDERAKIQKRVEQLKAEYQPGSKAYSDAEVEIAKRTSNLQIETQLKKKEFMQREAKLYFNTYGEITRAVEQFATEYDVDLVLRFSSKPIDQDKPQTVLQGVNASVVFHKKRDITKFILDIVNQGSPPPDRNTRKSTIPGRTR